MADQGNEAGVAVGIGILLLFAFLLCNPSLLIGLLVYLTTAIVVVGSFAAVVFLMFVVLKQIFK